MKLKNVVATIGVVVALLILSNIMHDSDVERKEAAIQAAQAQRLRLAKQQRDALAAEFQANKAQLLYQAQHLIDQGEPVEAQAVLARFAPLKDPEVDRLQAQVKNYQRIKTLSDELARRPVSVRAMAIYQELTALEPSNPLWPTMAEQVRPMVEEAKAQQAKDEAAAALQAAGTLHPSHQR